MAYGITAYKWDTSENHSENFSFTTKYYDLGVPTEFKNVYRVGITFGVLETLNLGFWPMIQIDYRTKPGGTWGHYGSMTAEGVLSWAQFTDGLTVLRKKTLKKVPGIQLRIRGHLPGSIYINDLSIEYRNLRIKAVGSP